MKKVIIALGAIFLFIILATFLIPIIFKDDIQKAIDKQIDQNLEAKVSYDRNSIGLSVFAHFPSITASVGDLTIVGIDEFRKDTLLSVGKFEIAINILSLFKDQIKINGIYLTDPSINIITLENGMANYDIVVAAPPSDEPEEADDLNIGIDQWHIKNGSLVYDDRSLPFYLKITDLEHSGSGDLSKNIFDLDSKTKAMVNSVIYEGMEYLTYKKIDADVLLSIDLDELRFTFKENDVQINDFGLQFEGFLAMPTDNIMMDIAFGAKQNTFNSILSLVPGMYADEMKPIQSTGNMSFAGFVKGVYSETSMPAFNLNIAVNDGMFKFDDLPTAVENISVALEIDNKDGIIDNTSINISQFHMDMGNNPVDGKIFIKNLYNYDVEANVQAKINLAELTDIFPIEGTTLRGMFNANLIASGIYDSVKNTIPKINLDMKLTDGYAKYADYPIPMESINMRTSVINSSGKMAETLIQIDQFSMLVDGEALTARATVQNLEDYTWDVSIKGGLDLEKVMKIFPIEGTTLVGMVKADVDSKGKMSDVTAQRYERIAATGSFDVQNFLYESTDFPQGFGISSANATINPRAINLTSFDGMLGKSDIQLSGELTNYMAFLLQSEEVIRGRVALNSRKFDLNEWMSGDTVDEDTSSLNLEVIKVPENIDFVMQSSINEVLYDNLTIKNLQGVILVKDGALRMQDVQFNLLEGVITMDGAYITKNMEEPLVNFDFGIKDLSIQESFKSIEMIRTLAPVAEHLTGKFSTDFKIAGHLGQDMMPIYPTLTGAGLIEVIQAAIQDMPILTALSNFTNLKSSNTGSGGFALKDVLMAAEVKEGRLHVQPFELELGEQRATVSGSTGIDGSIDYDFATLVPTGAAGAAVNASLSSLLGGQNIVGNDINLTLKLTGSYADPKVSIGSAQPSSGSSEVKSVAKEKMNEEIEKQKTEIENKARQEVEEQTDVVKKEAEKLENRAKEELKEVFADSARSTTIDGAKDAIKGLFKKKEGGN